VSTPWTLARTGHARQGAEEAALALRLPFSSRLWRGHAGPWLGTGRGSSLEFEDHRAYVPGDDLRRINWQAYARTGNYSLKLYREEVSPSLDVVLDVSRSMVVEERKAQRALELLFFAVLSARGVGTSVRLCTAYGPDVAPLTLSPTEGEDLTLPVGGCPEPPDLKRVLLRAGSLRVLITDGLFEASPEPLLARLSEGGGRGVVFLPFSPQEAEPHWDGPLELVDCETNATRDQMIDASATERYREAYRRHFALWHDAGRRLGAAVARVSDQGTLLEALHQEAFSTGAVEPLE